MNSPTVGAPALADLALGLTLAARAARQRRALVLAGAQDWCLAGARAALDGTGVEAVLWVGRNAPEGVRGVAADQATSVLGQEVDALVFDAWSGFDPDAFGAVAGTLRGGGLLVLLTPPLDAWPGRVDPENARIAVAPFGPEAVGGRFFRHLVRVLKAAQGLALVEQGHPPPSPPDIQGERSAGPQADSPETLEGAYRTRDQARAVEAVIKVVSGQRRRPAVLTSDRGRGKSAALGIAAARLIAMGTRHIVVTGPRLAAVQPVFEHARRWLPGAQSSRAALHHGEARLEYAPPDELVHTPRPADLVLVDEAAALPTPLLETLLQRYSRMAFATTVHGYEGTGRGFALRFHRVLDLHTRGWRALRLEEPVRWADGDPLERLVFRALLLDATAAPDPVVTAAQPRDCETSEVDRDRLVDDEATLGELFGLLVLAHYRTRPYDLRHLLDGPNLSVHLARHRGHVVGCALVAAEGGFDAATARAIWKGRTRPHGHLLPESLSAHLGLEDAARLHAARVMRIAVHPAAQGRGIGRRLLAHVTEKARAAGLDYLGSSFGATGELLRFWSAGGLRPVRLSVTRGAASGAHSAIVLAPLSAAGQALCETARARFLDGLPHQLADPLRELEPALAETLLRADNAPPPDLDHQDWRDVVAFACAKRVYEACMAPLWRLARTALADPAAAPLIGPEARAALIVKVLQRRDWPAAAQALNLPGRAQVVDALRHAYRPLLLHYADDALRAEAMRMGCGQKAQ
jgi:tRNA(Met) cytidine acetyltransferase